MAPSTPEPIGAEATEATLLDPGNGAEEILGAGDRAIFGRSRVRAPRDPLELPDWISASGIRIRDRWQRLAPRRRLQLKFGVVLVAAVALAATLIVSQPGPVRPSTPVVAQRPQPSSVPLARSTYDPDSDVNAIGPPLAVPGGPVRDIAIASNDLYVVGASTISVVDSFTRQVLRQADVTTTPGSVVVLDQSSGTLWVIDIGATPSYAREFDMVSLQLRRSVSGQGVIYDAVELDSRLYLATSGGVFLIAPGSADLTAVASTTPEPLALTVNPQADTVLALSATADGRVLTFSNSGDTIQAGPTLSVSNPTIAVINNALWAGGVNPDARLLRLDKNTLRPLPESAGGVLVAEGTANELRITAGVADLWVYNNSVKQLLCVDATSGQVLQRWDNINGSVATGGSGPDVVNNGVIQPLVLRGNCLG